MGSTQYNKALIDRWIAGGHIYHKHLMLAVQTIIEFEGKFISITTPTAISGSVSPSVYRTKKCDGLNWEIDRTRPIDIESIGHVDATEEICERLARGEFK